MKDAAPCPAKDCLATIPFDQDLPDGVYRCLCHHAWVELNRVDNQPTLEAVEVGPPECMPEAGEDEVPAEEPPPWADFLFGDTKERARQGLK